MFDVFPAADPFPALLYTMHHSPGGRQTLQRANAALRDLYGLDPATADAQAMEAAVHPNDRLRLAAARATAAAALAPLCIEYRILHPVRGEVWIEERAVVEPQADGARVWSGVQLDIDARKRAEAERDLKAEAFDRADQSIFLIDAPTGQVLYVNPAACRALGYSPEELKRLTPFDFDPDLTPETLAEHVALTAAEGKVTFETRHRHRDGHAFPVEVMSTRFDHRGRNVVLSVAVDISRRRAAQESLARSEREYRTLVENAPANLIRYDREGRVRYLNPQLERVLGRTTAEVAGLRPGEAWPDGYYAPLEASLHRVLAGGPAEAFDMPYLDACHGPAQCSLHIAAERDADGAVCGAIAFSLDITPLKAAQRELERSRAQLRELAARHDRDQETRRKHLAWDVHEGVGQQLAALRMQLLALRAGSAAAQRERIGGMLALVDQGIAQVRRVTAALRPRVLDLGLPAALEWLCEAFAERTGVSCDADVPSGPVGLDEAQAVALYRVAEEGLDNVARHAWAEWTALRLERDEGGYRLELRDDGRGFDLASARAGATVGLAWMEERIGALGGTFRVESAPGRGTVLEVRVGSLA